MSQHNLLRERYLQHKIKNNYSNIDDQTIKAAVKELVQLLIENYPEHSFEIKNDLTFTQIKNYSKINIDNTFDYSRRKLIPDGGVIWMDNKYPILITEMKHQGTNNERQQEGLHRQAVGNAIERLGKNLRGFEVLYQNDDILPFICFCWGCDFSEDTVIAKLLTMNCFQPINQTYTNIDTFKRSKPFNIFTKIEEAWTVDEMVDKMIDIVEYSINYYEKEI